MPNIIEYSASPDQTVHPSDVGERASVQAAYKISQTADQTAAKIKQGFGEVGRMVTDYQNLQKHKDLANGMAGLATAESTAYDQAQDKMKEPGFSDQADAPQQIADIYKAQSQKVIDAAPAGEVRDALIEHDSQRQLARHTQALTDLANVSKAQTDIAANQLANSLAGLAAKDPTCQGPVRRDHPGSPQHGAGGKGGCLREVWHSGPRQDHGRGPRVHGGQPP